ncbi:MAG: HlyD family efflux transporter periplasmic adaptor subunit [Alphaproteobacteria bacterium]|nr:MAG: HlyD family efflux transporter periplasmic adaptor subunit [Alphaproteobacteria bacterium]
MTFRILFGLYLMTTFVAACSDKDENVLVGTLERERITLISEAPEPIVDIKVHERDRVAAGDVVLVQDASLLKAQWAQAQAVHEQARARLAEIVRGPRQERIDSALAKREAAQSAVETARKEFKRAKELVADGAVSQAFYDQSRLRLTNAEAELEQRTAELNEMLEGATAEELDQARAALGAAEAVAQEAQVRLDRLTVRAPVAGTIEALPFDMGERPPAGAAVAILSGGTVPYARVFVPVDLRLALESATEVTVKVEGVEGSFKGKLRFISSEAAFTPYFALTEHDRTRLSYQAEIDLIEDNAKDLPTGLPVEIRLGE